MIHSDILAADGVRPENIVGVDRYSPTAVSHYLCEQGQRVEQRYRSHVHRLFSEAGFDHLVAAIGRGVP